VNNPKERHMRNDPSDNPIIDVHRLGKAYPGNVEAVKNVDFQVDAGEVFGLLGPNGAGKSTTIGMLTTTIRPTSGTARLAGYDVARQPLAARRISSVVFQDAVIDRPLTGRRNLELHGRLWRVDQSIARKRIAEGIEMFGLGDVVDRPVATYSGGQRRRLEIARALVSSPRVLFLDEPTVGLDPRIRHELLDVIGTLRAGSEMTIVLTTHYLDEAERLCDRVAVMRLGEIVALDTPAALLAGLGREIVELRIAGDAQAGLAVLQAQGIADDSAFVVGSTLTVPLRDRTAGDAIAAIDRSGLPVTSIGSRPPTLDDVYLRLTGDRILAAA
jgi:ABC-2 type transport system ATP-binding protein